MPKFAYVSRNPKGQRVTAVADAPNRQELLFDLKNRGLTVVEIEELEKQIQSSASGLKNILALRFLWGGVRTSELAIFWRQLATLIAAGLPIIEALESIAQELDEKKLKAVIDDMTARLWEGMSLSQSMRKHTRAFSPMVVALIGAAEESGSLPTVTNQLAAYLENRDRLFRKVITALTYPIFVSVFFLCVLAVANFWIIPRFRDIYIGFHAKLPALTVVVFTMNAIFLKYFPFIVLAGVGLLITFVLWAQKPGGRAVIDRISLRIPVFGALFQRAAVARFCRSLAVLLSGGVSINRALEMAEQTAGNSVVAAAIHASREDILKGNKITTSFRKQEIFPRMVVRMISSGEETGNLSGLLEKAAEFYETRVDAALTTINTLIEPVIIVIIGFFVLIFVLSIYMPIFSLGQNMRM